MSTVEDIENAILNTLKDDEALAGYVKHFMVLPDLGQEQIGRLIRKYPALAVISHEGRWTDGATSIQDETGTFTILCVNRNLRSPVAALRGVAVDEVGVYDLVEGVRRVLSPQGSVNLDSVYNCRPLGRRLLIADGQVAIYGVEVEVTWRHNL